MHRGEFVKQRWLENRVNSTKNSQFDGSKNVTVGSKSGIDQQGTFGSVLFGELISSFHYIVCYWNLPVIIIFIHKLAQSNRAKRKKCREEWRSSSSPWNTTKAQYNVATRNLSSLTLCHCLHSPWCISVVEILSI